jgi:hypothetical protein
VNTPLIVNGAVTWSEPRFVNGGATTLPANWTSADVWELSKPTPVYVVPSSVTVAIKSLPLQWAPKGMLSPGAQLEAIQSSTACTTPPTRLTRVQ